MADQTAIEWTDATWNPITGCSVASPGCTNCYAMKLAGTRLAHHPSRAGLTRETKAGPVWTGEVRLNEEWLTQPLRWKRPRKVFVCAHGDLFHENVPDEWIDRVFAVMALAPQHTFQCLTKRADRMRDYMSRACGRIADAIQPLRTDSNRVVGPVPHVRPGATWWPLLNVWLGVSVEDQERADERIPDLLATPAAVRWISAEPLLGPVDLRSFDLDFRPGFTGFYTVNALTGRNEDMCRPCRDVASLDWVVAGGESGPGARGSTDMVETAMRLLRDQCRAAGVAFFGKQNFKKHPLPDDLLIREWPR